MKPIGEKQEIYVFTHWRKKKKKVERHFVLHLGRLFLTADYSGLFLFSTVSYLYSISSFPTGSGAIFSLRGFKCVR